MTERWLSHYDWRVQETALNAHPQFKADVDGTELHFVHVRGKGKNPTPLLLHSRLPRLFLPLSQGHPAAHRPRRARARSESEFRVVVPSLPGFGFSASTPWPSTPPPTSWPA